MLEGTIVRTNEKSTENPGIDAVFDACKHCYRPQSPVTVHFQAQFFGKSFSERIEVNVREVGHESGQPGMLLLEGYLKRPIDGHTEYKAFYDAREGHFTGHITLLRMNERK